MAVLLEMSEELVVPIVAWARCCHHAPAQGFPAQVLCSTRDAASITRLLRTRRSPEKEEQLAKDVPPPGAETPKVN